LSVPSSLVKVPGYRRGTPLTSSIIEELARYLPPNLQQLVLNPPNLSSPSSFLPLIRAILPYTQIIIVIVAVYIVWSFISGIFGFFARFARFGLKISPIIGLIGWFMANSGQGNMSDVMELVKQAVGISSSTGGGSGLGAQAQSAGIAGLANLFGLNGNNADKAKKSGYSSGGNKRTTRSSTKRNANANAGTGAGTDDIEAILKSATGAHPDDDWSEVIQKYVKSSVLKASGLDWLFGEKDETKRTSR
jgi:hypothetical protein